MYYMLKFLFFILVDTGALPSETTGKPVGADKYMPPSLRSGGDTQRRGETMNSRKQGRH